MLPVGNEKHFQPYTLPVGIPVFNRYDQTLSCSNNNYSIEVLSKKIADMFNGWTYFMLPMGNEKHVQPYTLVIQGFTRYDQTLIKTPTGSKRQNVGRLRLITIYQI